MSKSVVAHEEKRVRYTAVTVETLPLEKRTSYQDVNVEMRKSTHMTSDATPAMKSSSLPLDKWDTRFAISEGRMSGTAMGGSAVVNVCLCADPYGVTPGGGGGGMG